MVSVLTPARLVLLVLLGIDALCMLAVILLLNLNSYRIADQVYDDGVRKFTAFTNWGFWQAKQLYKEQYPDGPLLKQGRRLVWALVALGALAFAIYKAAELVP